jgi:hypothetical protein
VTAAQALSWIVEETFLSIIEGIQAKTAKTAGGWAVAQNAGMAFASTAGA